jgi:hypothetical protein
MVHAAQRTRVLDHWADDPRNMMQGSTQMRSARLLTDYVPIM